MEDNNKLFVFDKKEVVLIFVFIVVIAVTAFTLGVRIGKQLSLKEDGYTKQDIESIDLKSVDEEYVDDVVQGESPSNNFESALKKSETSKKTAPIESANEVEARLREEMAKLAAGGMDSEAVDTSDTSAQATESDINEGSVSESSQSDQELGSSEINSTDDLYAPSENVKGKFTIQLYANQSKAAAQDFADAFIVKGYDVIINEASIPGKGNWYRVSIGVFDTIDGAKAYLAKEKSLFQGEDYIIQQL